MRKRFFITGTDTEIGKTTVSEALLRSAQAHGLSTLGLKPLAAGADDIDGQWRNGDALTLQAASSVKVPYETINPVLLKAPMAPHIAAEREQRRVTVQSLAGFCRGAFMSNPVDFTLVEGAGGWVVPVNSRETLADLARELQLEVILVVGMKLGCLNHALLTARAIQADGVKLAGWVANQLSADMNGFNENLQTLQRLMPAPMIGLLPFMNSDQAIAAQWAEAILFGSDPVK
ncbi:MAG: dethiobiotin synthase [Reinekea sp.]|jgi:dethiobiotin synthetase